MAKQRFDFKSVENKWRKFWEKEKIFKADLSSEQVQASSSKNRERKNKKIYSVDTPPPYISGRMHIGHAFSYSQQDFIVRFRRMFEGNVFYPFGTDDNGLPTERFIEKRNNVKSRDLGRAEFIKLCLKTLKKVTPECVQDFKDLGISADYDVYYSTIDDNSRKISQKSFIDLYKQGDAYSREFPTMWCPECQTSIAQAELEDREEKSLFSTLRFSCEGKDLLIATTRPELLGACVAVFVHPNDKRYKKLIGKKAKVPLFDYEVPIIADKSAEMEKGTGILMICSYGDRFDVDAINRHKLEQKLILDKQGKIINGDYKDLKVKDVRKKILQDLRNEKLIKEQKEISHIVNCHDKCGTAIEFIPTKQWFIKILDKKKKFIELGRKINWYPEFMRKRYENWVNGLEWDWSISRNRHFGVPIPVWECKDCNEVILASEKELPVDPLQIKKKCPKCKKDAIPEEMVLDTWATSSLTPQIADSLVGNKIGLPFSLRPQGHDIIRTWAFYTIVKGYLHEKKIPWENIMISGNVSLGGEKMSKSKGNVVDPRDVLEKYGADALRFWAAGSKLGSDLDYQEKDLIAGTKMINKLLNASRFVFMNLGDWDGKKPKNLEALDELFLKVLDVVIFTTRDGFDNYEYSRAKLDVENLFWREFCDYYLEFVKKRIYQGKGEDKKSAQYVLYHSLLTILKMIAPIMPFITEEIYQEYFRKTEKDKSIHISKWPKFEWNKKKSLGEPLSKWRFICDLISKIRYEKSKNKKAMNSEIILTLTENQKTYFIGILDDLKNVTNAKEIKEGKKFKVEFVD